MMGNTHIPLSDIWSILLGRDIDNEVWASILLKIRLPKAITAILAGSALSVSGLLMQTLFRNPLAGPSVLGITSGASLGMAFVMFVLGNVAGIVAIQSISFFSSWLAIIAASLGAAMVLFIILIISFKLKDNITLLIIGIMIGNITLALVSIWQYFSQPETIKDYLIWTFGSLGAVTSKHLLPLSMIVVIGFLIAMTLVKPLNNLLLGELYAQSVGVNIKRLRIWVILSTSILAGSITAFCGPIGFVGIAVPHLTRSLFNTSNHLILIPATFLLGAILMLLCDILTLLPGYSFVLPINAITVLLGSPIIIWVIIKKRNLKQVFN